ncbi:MAG: 2OG-Fe(II) oxygenase family protein [Actinomycetota bacterium]
MGAPPLVDLGPLLAADTTVDRAEHTIARLHEACTETGFVVVTGHGIDDELSDLMLAARAFFAEPQQDKERTPRVDRYGFVPHAGTAIDATRASDRTEYLDLGLADEVPIPEVPGHDLAGAVRSYQRAALPVGHAVLAALASALGLDDGFFRSRMERPQCRLRLLHYPPIEPAADGTLPVPTEPHTDYGLITLLATDGVAGLEVKPLGGDWTPVDAATGQLVVNLGDMMARWTNDLYRSTPHRVVGPAEGDRISIPFFVNPDPATVVETIPACVTAERPAHYEPVTAGEFLARRIDGYDEPYVDRTEGPARRAPTSPETAPSDATRSV